MMVADKVSVLLVLAVLAGHAAAHGHKSRPLALEELPEVCQTYFKRAAACYERLDQEKVLFHNGNTDFLFQVLPAALPKQRVRMCEIANRDFAAKAAQLQCE